MIIDDINKYLIEGDYVGGPKIDNSGSAASVNYSAKHPTEVSIVSGDMFDAEMKHRLENFDKDQAKAILESKDIVKAYNDFIDLRISELRQKWANCNIDSLNIIFKTFLTVYENCMAIAPDKETEKLYDRYMRDGFIYTDQDPKFIRALLQSRLEYANTTQKLLKEIIQNNAKILKLSSYQIDTLIKGSGASNIAEMKKIIDDRQKEFIKNKYLADCREIGAGVFITGEEFEIGSVNVKFADYIQDMVNYDITVLAHGGQSNVSEKALSKLKPLAVKTAVESFSTTYSGKLLIDDIGKEAFDAKMKKEMEEMYDDAVIALVDDMKAKVGYNPSELTSEKDEYSELPDIEKAYRFLISTIKKLWAKEGHWEFVHPITGPDGKTYNRIDKFVRSMKQQGFKKIKLYSCNPGEFDLPADIKDGVVFSKRSNLVENTIISEEVMLENQSILKETYELEQLALQICEENGIDYNDDKYLTECVAYVNNNSIINEDNIVIKGIKVLIELCKKVIGAIVGFIKAIVSAIGELFTKIKSFIKNKDARKMKNKQIDVSVITMEAAKIKTSKVSSQEELYKAVEASINSVSKEYRKVADKQARINKELQSQLERADRKANNENATVYETIMNDLLNE